MTANAGAGAPSAVTEGQRWLDSSRLQSLAVSYGYLGQQEQQCTDQKLVYELATPPFYGSRRPCSETEVQRGKRWLSHLPGGLVDVKQAPTRFSAKLHLSRIRRD